MKKPAIHEARIALDKKLFYLAVEDWKQENRSGYKRINALGNPHSFAIIQLLSSFPNSDRDELFKILPKRSREYTQQADPTFFCANEQRLVEAFIGKIGKLSARYFDENEAVTAIFDKHDALRKDARRQAIEIRRSLFNYLKNECKEWGRYNLIKPEPNVITFEKSSSKFRIDIVWDFRPWEIFCGLNVYDLREPLIRNETFFGGLEFHPVPLGMLMKNQHWKLQKFALIMR